MTRIGLDTASASRRLALRRWLQARGHEICDATDPDVQLVLGESEGGSDPRYRTIPTVVGEPSAKVDFAALDALLARLAPSRGRRVEVAAPHAEELVAHSAPMRELLAKVDRLAAADLAVLIGGESGSGKEMVARELHRRGPRAQEPFLAVNCAALPDGLVESELFGHEKGSFTDAKERRLGYFERAGSGTLLLDEIGDLPPAVQAKLLRALQDREFFRVGGESPVPFRARVLSAAAADLEHAPHFRTDLFHRIAAARLQVPPLRARREDLPDLCAQLVAGVSGHRIREIDARVFERIEALSWPGNVRQLANVLRQAAVFATGPVLDVAALQAHLPDPARDALAVLDDALEAYVRARTGAGHSVAELREELLERLEKVRRPEEENR